MKAMVLSFRLAFRLVASRSLVSSSLYLSISTTEELGAIAPPTLCRKAG